ncbi:MAG: hypothetical protein ACOC1F_06075 [Myxococcota bacterium]
MLAAVATVAQLVMGKAVRDGFFLANFDADLLPRMMIVAAVASFASVLGVSRAMTRFSPFRVAPALFGAAAMLLVGHALLSQAMPRASAVALYLHMAVFGSTAVSSFWSLINERYDPHEAKRVVARLASGTTIGGILGGLVAWQAAERLPVSTLLYLMAGLNLLCLVGVLGIGKPASRADADREPPSLLAGLDSFRSAPYLRQLASLIVVTSIASALMDYFLGLRAKAVYEESGDLLSFYALYQLGVGILSFVVLSALSRPSLKTLGLAGTVALLPGSVVLGGILAVVVPGLWSAVAMRGLHAVMSNSLFRSGYELLFTPITAERKRATKLIIDVAFDRIGTAAGSGLAILVVTLAVPQSERVIAGLVVAMSLVGLWIAIRLHEGYVSALEDSLRAGAVKLETNEVVDATTWQTLTQTNLQLDRQKILEEIERLRRESAGSTSKEQPAADAPPQEATEPPPSLRDPLLQAIADLRSDQAAKARKVLSGDLDPRLVAHAIPLLANPDLRHDALHALRKVACRVNGQLVDALLDRDVPVVIRRRMARVLRRCPTQRTVDGLLAGLADARFEVRYQCGVALWAVLEESPELVVSRDAVLGAVRREVDVDREVWEAQGRGDVEDSQEDSVLEDLLTVRKGRSLAHVFRVMALAFEREPMMLALRAIEGDDARLRGTALEYLENVLPDDIRKRLWPFLGDGHPNRSGPARSRKEVLDELLASGAELNVDGLRRSLRRE